MKTIAALLLSATAAFAGSTENITGCATAAVAGTNATVRADVTCALSNDESDGSGLLVAVAAGALLDALDK